MASDTSSECFSTNIKDPAFSANKFTGVFRIVKFITPQKISISDFFHANAASG